MGLLASVVLAFSFFRSWHTHRERLVLNLEGPAVVLKDNQSDYEFNAGVLVVQNADEFVFLDDALDGTELLVSQLDVVARHCKNDVLLLLQVRFQLVFNKSIKLI